MSQLLHTSAPSPTAALMPSQSGTMAAWPKVLSGEAVIFLLRILQIPPVLRDLLMS